MYKGLSEKWRMIRRLPYVSIFLVVLNVIMFLISETDGGYLQSVGLLTVDGVLERREYGRLVLAMFLHGGIEHLFNNMLILYFMGKMIEESIGHLPYVIIYFLAGLGGNIVSLWYKVKTYTLAGSLGASGAVFGLDGLLLAMVLFYKKPVEAVTPRRILLMILLSLYSGFRRSNVDNAAHLGGLFIGLLAGGIYFLLIRRDRNVS